MLVCPIHSSPCVRFCSDCARAYQPKPVIGVKRTPTLLPSDRSLFQIVRRINAHGVEYIKVTYK